MKNLNRSVYPVFSVVITLIVLFSCGYVKAGNLNPSFSYAIKLLQQGVTVASEEALESPGAKHCRHRKWVEN